MIHKNVKINGCVLQIVNPIDEILVYELISLDEIINVEIVGGMAGFLMKYF